MLVKTACGVVGFSVLRCSHTIMYVPRLDASPPSHRRFFLRISMRWTKNPAFLRSRMIKILERLVRAVFVLKWRCWLQCVALYGGCLATGGFSCAFLCGERKILRFCFENDKNTRAARKSRFCVEVALLASARDTLRQPPSHRRFFLRISMRWTKNPAFLCSRMIKTLERLVRAAFVLRHEGIYDEDHPDRRR